MTTDATKCADFVYVPTSLPTRPVVDLTPLVEHFERELQRERDRALTAQSSERSARELVVELEAKLEAMTAKADEWRKQCAAGVAKQARLAEERPKRVGRPRPRYTWTDSDRAKLVRGATVAIYSDGFCADGVYTVHEFVPPHGLWLNGGDLGLSLEDFADPASLQPPAESGGTT